METNKVTVKFVKPTYPDGQTEVLAVFKDKSLASPGMLMCYAHAGQHSECTKGFWRCKEATASEYASLLRELERVGYDIIIANKGSV